jgi:uncharacterized protein
MIESKKSFLTAEWNHLVMANYAIDPAILKPLLPHRTELDEFNGEHFVSVVGFMFDAVRLKGFSIPFHTRFPEVNLRFYVRFKEGNEWRRGVVFISEIVPKIAISFVANTLFRERYSTFPMHSHFERRNGEVHVRYEWKKKTWQQIGVIAADKPAPLQEGSQTEFITQHFWGYAAHSPRRTVEYEVGHPSWRIYPVLSHQLVVNFLDLYGDAFAHLQQRTPDSIFLAEGSPIVIYPKRIIL